MRRSLVVAAASVALLGGSLIAAVPASAQPSTPSTSAAPPSSATACSADGGDPDPFTSKVTRGTGSVVGSDGRTVAIELRSGNNAANQQYAWVKISSAAGLKATDQVWLEISDDGGTTWAICGLTSPPAGAASVWTHGFRTSTSALVRMVGAAKVVQTPTDVVGRTRVW